MTASSDVEFILLHYVPNMLSRQRVSIAAIFVDFDNLEEGICTMSVAEDWRTKVRLLDPNADLEMLSALLMDIRHRLSSKNDRSDMLRQMEDSFSNAIQVSSRQKCPVSPTPENIEVFARGLWEAPML
jgi:hypothetical protein